MSVASARPAVVSGSMASARTSKVEPSGPVTVGGPAYVTPTRAFPLGRRYGIADVVGDLGCAALGAAARLPRRPGRSGIRAPAADENEERSHARARDDREQDVERGKAAAVGEAPRAVRTRFRASDDGVPCALLRHGLRIGRCLVHHIVGHELSSDRSTSGIVILASSSRFRSSSPKSSRRAVRTSAMCSTASRFGTTRLYAATYAWPTS